jgi:uncharacterized phage protein (TIGR01671 family)
MREIKFRAWSYKSKTMYSWSELLEDDLVGLFKEPQEELMQYTGLKDVNGKEIYEGDICQSYTFTKSGAKLKEHAMPIEFRDGMFAFGYYSSNLMFFIREYELEVIGNRFDNPSLIKE